MYYLDDTWLMSNAKEECCSNITATLKLLTDAGFLVNESKSVFAPSQTVKFLWFNLDSVAMTINLPLDKHERIISMCTILYEKDPTSIRYLAKVIGVLVSSLPAVPYGALFYRFLEHSKIRALKVSHGDFDSYTSISHNTKLELQWWITNAQPCVKLLTTRPFTFMLATDASLLGWGYL